MVSKSGKFSTDNEVVFVEPSSSESSTLTQIQDFEEEVLDSGYRTPPECIFDPFKPGPEELCLAPKRKMNKCNPLCRQRSLGFGLSSPTFDLDSEFEELEQAEKSSTRTLMHILDFEEEVLDSSCQTPPEYIFDAFAPAAEKFCIAPKMNKATHNSLRRQHSLGFRISSPTFDFESEFEEFEQEDTQIICKALLDLIISDVLEICGVEMLLEEKGKDERERQGQGQGQGQRQKQGEDEGGDESESEGDGFRTPIEMPLLNGVLVTCPGAPIRPSLKIPINLKWEMRRKLNFDLDLD